MGLKMSKSTHTSTGSHPIMLGDGWKSKPYNILVKTASLEKS